MDKVCTKCGILKPISEFNNHTKNETQSQCRICQNKQNREWYQKHKKEIQERVLKRRYPGIISNYEKMLESQNGVCAICRKPPRTKNQHGLKRLHVDHNHKTGQVRKLLCDFCNFLVGQVENHPTLICKVEKYIEEFE